MPSLYIILETKIPNTDIHVNGNFLSKHDGELEQLAKRLDVKPLMSFFSVSNNETSELSEEFGVDLSKTKEQWFAPVEGLQTLSALLQNLDASRFDHLERIESELQEFAAVLELAKTNGVRWHLAIDY
ncbi:MAG TPA: hypothetical protein VKH15_00670 [Candidatus Acidoferrum sp.]|nr:hypothetical protein [Candidatus Acidoferrum sp.]